MHICCLHLKRRTILEQSISQKTRKMSLSSQQSKKLIWWTNKSTQARFINCLFFLYSFKFCDINKKILKLRFDCTWNNVGVRYRFQSVPLPFQLPSSWFRWWWFRWATRNQWWFSQEAVWAIPWYLQSRKRERNSAFMFVIFVLTIQCVWYTFVLIQTEDRIWICQGSVCKFPRIFWDYVSDNFPSEGSCW